MTTHSLEPIPPDAEAMRRSRALREARSLGFVGRVEYHHVPTQSGGAQYGRGAEDGGDVLLVYAEAFDRDADPDDFSLRAILAHERGHQLLTRHPRLSRIARRASSEAEEVLASLLGALIVEESSDREDLISKAAFAMLQGDATPETVDRVIGNLLEELGELL